MREILFRGKRTDNGEWVYGNFVMDATELHQRERRVADPILADGFIRRYDSQKHKVEMFEVERETVGQYTGLTDKNDRKIFEGDIVRVHDYLAKRGDPWHEFEGVVGHQNASFVIISDVVKHYRWIDYECEIIGNIHDNPELLEE